ncbi:MAG: lipase maturation factor family protein [Chlamydiales bacterium]|nr:lipase maturation factor family protein [Chlamydiales bacterium]
METYELTRWLFLRAVAFIYCIAFAVAINQFRALCGERGLVPVPFFLKRMTWKDCPSLFWIHYSDRFAGILGWLGLALAIVALTGIADQAGFAVNIGLWFALWLFYLSFVNVGQVFYSFGWETLLLETGFLTIFLSPSHIATPEVLIWLLRWLLFRNMFGAGLIKLRADPCWYDLTCLHYHYQTQPMPNPLSWYFHYLPGALHKSSVLFTHITELIIPWLYFAPQPFCAVAGLITVFFQLMLVFSGNLSWLNWITIVLCIPCFSDQYLAYIIPWSAPTLSLIATPPAWIFVLILLTIAIVYLSIQPTINLFSPYQAMNASFDSLHLVNTYGAFGSVTKRRFEIVVEGTYDDLPSDSAEWREYAFKAKPGDVSRRPPIIAPYHLRLDWLMWFAAMAPVSHHPWFIHLVAKLLIGDKSTLKLMASDPFPDQPPQFIRAVLYEYVFTKPEERSSNWWTRRRISLYLEPQSLFDTRIEYSLRARSML